MKNKDTLRHRTRRSNSKFYARSREIPKIADRELNKKLKKLSHRIERKASKINLEKEIEEVVDRW